MIGGYVLQTGRMFSPGEPSAGLAPIIVARPSGARRSWLLADAAWRLGPRAVALYAWHRATFGSLRDEAPAEPPFFTPAPLSAPRDWHGPFDPAAPAMGMDLFAPGDVRPVWEASRLGALPRLAPEAAEALLAGWAATNPPFRGPNWACGQEAALRVLHIALALRGPPGPGLRRLIGQHATRIAATPAYALAQDNNHPISEAAGLFACDLLLGRRPRAGGRLARLLARLVSADGSFAPVSPQYQRLLLDVLWAVETLRRRHGAAPLPAPFAARAAAATLWLARLTCPATGALPRIGHCDGSAFGDLAGSGPEDARASVSRAWEMFVGGPMPEHADWSAAGLRGWAGEGARAVLRCGPIRFRPAHADLLHLDLWDGPHALLRDGGTGAYNPAPADRWWLAYFPGTSAHNTIAFDDRDQMPRAGRFLFAAWPRTESLPDGAAMTDHRGCRHERRIAVAGRDWQVEDRIAGPFRQVVLRWRLGGAWEATADGAAGPHGRIRLAADAPCTIAIEHGHESPAYGVVRPARVLTLRARAPVARIVTEIALPRTPG